MRPPLSLAFSLSIGLSFSAALGAQTAAFTTFGTGCVFAGQRLAIDHKDLPQLGGAFKITYSGPNVAASTMPIQPVLVLGTGLKLTPMPALVQQPPNCVGLITPDVFQSTAVNANGSFVASVELQVPNDPALLGVGVYAQWLTVAQQCGIVAPCNVIALLTSDAAKIVIGQ
jgi:hypothetical protein